MQQKMKDMQDQMSSEIFEGKSGGDLVKISMTGNGAMKGISIDASLLKPDEKEILEDLIIAAYNDAKQKAENASSGKMSDAFGDLAGKLPGGMKLPF